MQTQSTGGVWPGQIEPWQRGWDSPMHYVLSKVLERLRMTPNYNHRDVQNQLWACRQVYDQVAKLVLS